MDAQNSQVALALSLVAGTAGMTFVWHEMKTLRVVYGLAENLAGVKQKLDESQQRLTSRSAILEPHRQRLLQAVARTQHVLEFCCASEDPQDRENIPVIVPRICKMDRAVNAIEAELKVLEGTKDNLKMQYNEILHKLLRHMKPQEKEPQSPDGDNVISEEMYLPENLEEAEAECDAFDRYVSADDQDQEVPKDEQELSEKLKMDFLDLKHKKQELEEGPDAAFAQDEIAALDEQLLELSEQLILCGIIVRDGSIVLHRYEASDDARFEEAEIKEDIPQPVVEILQQTQISAQAVAGTPSQHIFDWTNFQAPIERPYGYNDAPEEWVTEAEAKERQEQIDRDFQEFIFKNNQRVQDWMQTAATEPEIHIDEYDDDVDESLPVGVEQLPDIEVGECFDMEAELATDNPSKSDVNIRRLQVETLLNQAERKFCSLTQAELESDPDFAVPCDWGEDVEMDY